MTQKRIKSITMPKVGIENSINNVFESKRINQDNKTTLIYKKQSLEFLFFIQRFKVIGQLVPEINRKI